MINASGSHELVLLSPYRYPAGSPLTLANEDMAAWLNGFTALWHPAALGNASGPPRCETPYDHETPGAEKIYAVPDSPPSYLPENWLDRVRQAGSICFTCTPDREQTLANLREALHAAESRRFGWPEGMDQPAEVVAPFFGIGWGHLLQATLAEAMEHENLLDSTGFWSDVQLAVSHLAGWVPAPEGESLGAEPEANAPALSEERLDLPEDHSAHAPDLDPVAPGYIPEPPPAPPILDWRNHLESAVQKLLYAREVLYPVTIHLVDLHLADAEQEKPAWHTALATQTPVNILACTQVLEKLAHTASDTFQSLKEAIQAGRAEVVGGSYVEREENLLPIDSQLWNLREGLAKAKELLDTDLRVFGRRRFGFTPQTPLLLSTHGVTKAVMLVFDEASGVPHYTGCVASWSSPDGKQIDVFVRAPKPADSPDTYFNLGNAWFKTTREDHAATLAFLHGKGTTAPWHRDLLELAKLGGLLGTWQTFSQYLTEVTANEYPPALSADDFHHDFLTERVEKKAANPVSYFVTHHRVRRRLDAAWTYAALHRALAGKNDTLQVAEDLQRFERDFETSLAKTSPAPDAVEVGGFDIAAFEALEQRIVSTLTSRLQSRATSSPAGTMLLNPCGFARRAAVELPVGSRPLPITGAVKACQLDADSLKVVVEIPALGFCWLPKEGPAGTAPMSAKMRLADAPTHTIRNEFFEAEVDPQTGALKAIRDHKTRLNRLGQQLVFNPGSRMVADSIRVTSAGPALGEIVAQGNLVGEQNQVLAKFRQRFRAWFGRPLLEMRIEIEPVQPPAGYGWHAYYGARFAWRDERMTLIRGVNGTGYVTQHPRPQSPDYLEVRAGNSNTVLFTGGLPFHHKQGGRMVDVILVAEGEKETVFDLGIAMDRDQPMQTALGYVSPLAVVPTTKGPPHVGASGWLFHVDASNMLLTRLTPGRMEQRLEAPPDDADPANAPSAPTATVEVEDVVVARFLEIAGSSGFAEFRCVRDPKKAVLLNNAGQFMLEAGLNGDAINLEVSPNDLAHVQIEFS